MYFIKSNVHMVISYFTSSTSTDCFQQVEDYYYIDQDQDH
jgi:hypothetical protein